MRSAPYLLWVDSETTSLHHPTNTILEMGWFVSDSDGVPITPLRSRFTAIHPDDSPVIPTVDGVWDVEAGLTAVPSAHVRTMHDKSGLAASHADAQGEGNVIGHAATLERLMLDDLHLAWNLAPAVDPRYSDAGSSTLSRLAGSGVAHFEAVQFTLNFPAVHGGPTAALHYRPCDVSGALEVLTKGRTDIGQILAANTERAEALADTMPLSPWPWYGLCTYAYDAPERTPHAWVAATDIPHRAAADVVRSWVAYRLLHDADADIPHRS